MEKQNQPICQFLYPKPPMKHTKMLLLLDEQDRMPNHGEINIQFYKKLVDMGLNEDIYFEQFLLDLNYSTQYKN
jgi:hypothetical protein